MAVNDSIAKPEIGAPCEEEEPPTGVVTPVNDCQTNFAATYPQGTPERDFLNLHPEIEVALDGMLFRATDCEEATDFANWAVKYLIEHPSSFPDDNLIEKLENIYWQEEFIDATDLENNPCTNAVYQEMKQTQLMAKLLRRFSGSKPILNLDWDIADLGACSADDCSNGQTDFYQTYVNITLNSQMIENASKIWVAKTMLHELIHAYIIRLIVMQGATTNISASSFPSLWNSFVINNRNGQHEYMAQFYIESMIETLNQYSISAQLNIPEEVIRAICWSGLHNTTGWDSILTDEQRSSYRAIFSQQLAAGGCN